MSSPVAAAMVAGSGVSVASGRTAITAALAVGEGRHQSSCYVRLEALLRPVAARRAIPCKNAHAVGACCESWSHNMLRLAADGGEGGGSEGRGVPRILDEQQSDWTQTCL